MSNIQNTWERQMPVSSDNKTPNTNVSKSETWQRNPATCSNFNMRARTTHMAQPWANTKKKKKVWQGKDIRKCDENTYFKLEWVKLEWGWVGWGRGRVLLEGGTGWGCTFDKVCTFTTTCAEASASAWSWGNLFHTIICKPVVHSCGQYAFSCTHRQSLHTANISKYNSAKNCTVQLKL